MSGPLHFDDFDAFFAAVHDGQPPYAWQRRLLDHVLRTGQWPEVLDAPTGAGKTAVIDVHVFAVAMMASGHATRVPRRLALVVPRRALVDDQLEHAIAVRDALAAATTGSLRVVADALETLRIGRSTGAVTVARLRGGELPSQAWRDDPLGCVVLCCTPDMWGSRALLRGYGTSRGMRPVEAALLTQDAVLVVDEAHLAGQLLATARRIDELQRHAPSQPGVPGLQVVETTATPAQSARTAVGVLETDLRSDPVLAARLTQPKTLVLRQDDANTLTGKGAQREAALAVWASEVQRLRTEHGPTVGAFTNRVADALDLTHLLRSRGLSVEVVCGRLRPHDLVLLRQRCPGLLDVRGNEAVDVLVSTQSLEVGVDLDLSAAVTALAPATSMVQRFGRVNRRGRRPSAEVVVLAPSTVSGNEPPYAAADLEAGLNWAAAVADTDGGVCPWSLRGTPPPSSTPRRVLHQRLELWDSWLLARTSERLMAEPGLDLWISDDLDADHSVGVVVRDGLGQDMSLDARLLELTPPQAHEVAPGGLATTRAALSRIADGAPAALWVMRSGEWALAEWTEGAGAQASELRPRLRPGDVVAVPSSSPLFRSGVLVEVGGETLDDVAERWGHARTGELLLRVGTQFPSSRELGPDALDTFLNTVAALDEPVTGPDVLAPLRELAAHATNPVLAAHIDALLELAADGGGRSLAITVLTTETDQDTVRRVVVLTDARRALRDQEVRQVWTPRGAVPLDQHSRAVADRVQTIAQRLGLPDDLVDQLAVAGELHDEGKRASLFQRMLGAQSAEVLAKSGTRTVRQVQRAQTESGLPPGWRHEQLSAAVAWDRGSGWAPARRQLITRLVGTSHGRGRAGFNHDRALLAVAGPVPEDAVRELFDTGEWEELVEHTEQEWGVWGVAYLEALLRCADGQVSAEGS
jgi:CRISPR-associated endonuclease/helicase Cas3